MELPTAPVRLTVLVAGLAALALAATPPAAAGPTTPLYDSEGNVIGTPFVPQEPRAQGARFTEKQIVERVLAEPKVRDWIARYPEAGLTDEATLDEDSGHWEVKVWSSLPDAGQIVLAKVEDSTGRLTEAWTGPQVAWGMARGSGPLGAFGRKINEPWIWLSFCGLFVLGLANFRRPLSLRNLDLFVLLSFSFSLYYFNHGAIFTAMPLVYPPLAYLLGRLAWIGWTGRTGSFTSHWPVWVLIGATVFLLGFRVGLNVRASNVIDVGLASVQGAQRIVEDGEMPYGHMPSDDGKECGPADSNGYVRERIQTNGRCESANERGDTYGPVSYLGYVPGVLAFGWSGKWDYLPAAHMSSISWDVLALLGLGALGLRFGGLRVGALLAFAWAAYPFTQYVSSSNSNDAIMPALLVWGLVAVTSAPARGLLVGLASWAKFAALLLLPLWASYPDGLKRPGQKLVFAGGVALASVLSFWILLLEPDPVHAAGVFWDRTFGWQLSRSSPFSIWDWNEYPGFPDLQRVQTALKLVLLALAIGLYFVPRRKSPLQLAALSGLLLVGFEAVLTHWFYLYIPWFFPFVAFAFFAPAVRREPEPAAIQEREHPVRELVPAG